MKTTIIFTLEDTLKELGITKNALSVESKVRPGTIADIVNGKAKSVSFETLTAIIDALNRIRLESGKEPKRYGIEDVFTHGIEK